MLTDLKKRNILRRANGLREVKAIGAPLTLEEIARISWFYTTIRYAQNRMLIGYFRYGLFKDPKQPNFDRIGSAIYRLKKYMQTGNTEYIIDAFNLCGIEFETPGHPRAYFKAIDDGYHTPIKRSE